MQPSGAVYRAGYDGHDAGHGGAFIYRIADGIHSVKSLLWYLLAAFGEIAGCFAFWAWLRLGKSPLWTVAGMASLAMFATALTRVETSAAGRAYAAYGGIYIVSSLLWLWLVEKTPPDKSDMIGATVCIAGAAIIFFGRHSS